VSSRDPESGERVRVFVSSEFELDGEEEEEFGFPNEPIRKREKAALALIEG